MKKRSSKGPAHADLVPAVESVEPECPKERTSTRLRAFLARTRPTLGADVPDWYWDGRQLIEQLALHFELGTQDESNWGAGECIEVLRYITLVQPVEGACFCNDASAVNATCGFHALLFFVIDVIAALPKPSIKGRKRAEVAHG
jgi:hypothetical protein